MIGRRSLPVCIPRQSLGTRRRFILWFSFGTHTDYDGLWKNFKTCCYEMTVCGENLLYTEFCHDDKTGAIGKGKGLVLPLEKPLDGLFHSIRVDPFRFAPGTLTHELPPALSRPQTKTHPDEGQRFINDIIGKDQNPAFLQPMVSRSQAGEVKRVFRIRHGHPAGCIHKQTLHSSIVPYSTSS